MARTKPEDKLRRKIQKRAREEYDGDIWIEHPTAGMYGSGLLDLMVCLYGKFGALEVKYGRGRPTERQLEVINRIRAAGGIAEVVRSVDEAMEVLLAIAES